MNLPTKFGLGAITVGTVTGISSSVGTYFGSATNKVEEDNPINEIVEKQYDYILLAYEGQDFEESWRANWNKYQSANAGKEKWKDELQLNGWPVSGEKDLINELKQKCKELRKGRAKSIEDDLYKKITTYCSREVNLEEQARKENLKIADTEADKDMLLWNARSGSVSYLDVEFKKLGISTTSVGSQQIREVCENSKKKSKHDKSLYAAYTKVCTKKDRE